MIPLIESESIRELLRTVHPSMRRDVRTLFLFLPYVLLHAVKSKNNSQYIQEEILAVIGKKLNRKKIHYLQFLAFLISVPDRNLKCQKYVFIKIILGLENFEMENAVKIERSRYKMLRHIRMTPSINSVQTEEGNQVNNTYTSFGFELQDNVGMI